MRMPDKNSESYKFNVALYGKYVPVKERNADPEKRRLYYATMGLLVADRTAKWQDMLHRIDQAGIMSPALRAVLNEFAPKNIKGTF